MQVCACDPDGFAIFLVWSNVSFVKNSRNGNKDCSKTFLYLIQSKHRACLRSNTSTATINLLQEDQKQMLVCVVGGEGGFWTLRVSCCIQSCWLKCKYMSTFMWGKFYVFRLGLCDHLSQFSLLPIHIVKISSVIAFRSKSRIKNMDQRRRVLFPCF